MKKIFIGITVTIVLCLLVFGVVSYFSVDRTAKYVGEGDFLIKGERYVSYPVGYTDEGRTVAKADNFDIMEIPEDEDRNFLAVRSFLDNWTIVKESYEIPDSGKLNVAYCEYERIADGEKLHMVQSILDDDFQGSFVIKTDAESEINNATKSIYVGYEDCPVGTEWIGAIGNINDRLVFIKTEDMKDGDLRYTCYILNSEYQELYSESVYRTFQTAD